MLLSAILVLLLILVSHSPTTSPTSPSPASCTYATSAASDPCLTLKLHPLYCHLHRPLKTRLLQLPLPQPRLHPNTASTAHPKLTRTRCHQNAPASSYHSCP